MKKKVLLALDLEGVNFAVGEPYMGLSKGTEQYDIAVNQAVLEINAAAEALFDAGVQTVALWDNHGGGNNVDPERLDSRIEHIKPEAGRLRMYFGGDYDCICYFGYHAMEGTLGGVLAHTMNSKVNQHYKLNGRYIGEVDMDAYIAASHGVSSCFFAGGDIACRQAAKAVDGIVTVVTKRELSRNEAEFRDNAELLADIKANIVKAVNAPAPIAELAFPSTLEKSFKRVEDAANYIARLRKLGFDSDYPDDEILGKDGHTVVTTVCGIEEFIRAI